MTSTVFWNYVYNIVCIICAVYGAIPQSTLQIIPAKYQPYVVGFFSVAMWIKSHWNLFISSTGVKLGKVSLTGK